MNKITIISDTTKFDYNFIYTKLVTTYWANKRTPEIVELSFKNSVAKMIYVDDKPIAFGRVVTDYAVFAYVADVFVSEEYRGQGLSKTLMDSLMHEEKLAAVTKWMLVTNDAHSLYEKYGFTHVKHPDRYMEYYTTGA